MSWAPMELNSNNGNVADIESPILANEVRKNKSTSNYVNYSISTITKYIKEYKGNIYELLEDNLIDGEFQENAIFPKNAKIENNVLKCKIKFDIFDHYGLNDDDLKCSKVGMKFISLAGFWAWHYLQHSVKYKGKFKPFVTHAIFYEDFEVVL